MKNKITVITFAFLLFAITALCWFKPDTAFSESERRPLASAPALSAKSLLMGEYMDSFETFTVDQFPGREYLRKLKAMFVFSILNKQDNNGLFSADGHISKIEYPENPEMIENAKNKFDYLYNTYMKDTNSKVYLSLVPDKNMFLAEKNGIVSLNYESFIENFKNKMDYMEYIDIVPFLSADDYYNTDSHWRQEKITDIAEHIVKSMGEGLSCDYKENTLDNPFYGVYKGQSALPFKADTIKYLTNDILNNCKVEYLDTGKPVKGDMYNMEKAYGKDPYEMFLSGTSALIEITNPDADTDKELVVFRDSFGSSLVPLLVPAYSKITVVDIRYIQSGFVGNFVKFNNQDVLFIYSTTLINNSMSLR